MIASATLERIARLDVPDEWTVDLWTIGSKRDNFAGGGTADTFSRTADETGLTASVGVVEEDGTIVLVPESRIARIVIGRRGPVDA